jgi:hypothetical protein
MMREASRSSVAHLRGTARIYKGRRPRGGWPDRCISHVQRIGLSDLEKCCQRWKFLARNQLLLLLQLPQHRLQGVQSQKTLWLRLPVSYHHGMSLFLLFNDFLMRPSSRNLFACDYLKDHSLTKSAFKTVWDNIDLATKKVCAHP